MLVKHARIQKDPQFIAPVNQVLIFECCFKVKLKIDCYWGGVCIGLSSLFVISFLLLLYFTFCCFLRFVWMFIFEPLLNLPYIKTPKRSMQIPVLNITFKAYVLEISYAASSVAFALNHMQQFITHKGRFLADKIFSTHRIRLCFNIALLFKAVNPAALTFF